MTESRLGDPRQPPQRRSARIYETGGQWFFDTREGTPMGPFASREAAIRGLRDFLEFLRLAPLPTLASLTDALTPEEADTAAGEER